MYVHILFVMICGACEMEHVAAATYTTSNVHTSGDAVVKVFPLQWVHPPIKSSRTRFGLGFCGSAPLG